MTQIQLQRPGMRLTIHNQRLHHRADRQFMRLDLDADAFAKLQFRETSVGLADTRRKNRDGWFRMDLRKGWIERAEVLFLKPKV